MGDVKETVLSMWTKILLVARQVPWRHESYKSLIPTFWHYTGWWNGRGGWWRM